MVVAYSDVVNSARYADTSFGFKSTSRCAVGIYIEVVTKFVVESVADAGTRRCPEHVAYAVEGPTVVAVSTTESVVECGVESLSSTYIIIEVSVVFHACGVGLTAVSVSDEGVIGCATRRQEDGVECGVGGKVISSIRLVVLTRTVSHGVPSCERTAGVAACGHLGGKGYVSITALWVWIIGVCSRAEITVCIGEGGVYYFNSVVFVFSRTTTCGKRSNTTFCDHYAHPVAAWLNPTWDGKGRRGGTIRNVACHIDTFSCIILKSAVIVPVDPNCSISCVR